MPNKLLSTLNKKMTTSNVLRLTAFIIAVVYIFEVLPRLTRDVALVFSNSFINVALVVLVVCIACFDLPTSLVFLVLLVLTHYSFVHRGYIGRVLSNVTDSASEIVKGATRGTEEIVVHLGSGVKNTVTGLSEGASDVLNGVSRGTQQLISGAGDGASDVLSGVSRGTQQLISGAEDGTQHLVQGTETGVNNVIGGLNKGGQKIIGGLNRGVNDVVRAGTKSSSAMLRGVRRGTQRLLGKNVVEGMEVQGLSVDQVFQQHLKEQNQGDRDCNVNPTVSSGCNRIMGYNANLYNKTKENECQFKGVSVWNNSMNTQGLNDPIGYSEHNSIGSVF